MSFKDLMTYIRILIRHIYTSVISWCIFLFHSFSLSFDLFLSCSLSFSLSLSLSLSLTLFLTHSLPLSLRTARTLACYLCSSLSLWPFLHLWFSHSPLLVCVLLSQLRLCPLNHQVTVGMEPFYVRLFSLKIALHFKESNPPFLIFLQHTATHNQRAATHIFRSLLHYS